MKKTLLLLICSLSFIGCAVYGNNNTVKSVSFEPEVEPLPIVADLLVSEQRETGEASGKIHEIEKLKHEARAKALGQEPPSADKPDVLVGMNVFTEISGNFFFPKVKLTVTGYPAYYTNFRTAKEEDLERLNIAKLDHKVPDSAAVLAQPKKTPSKFGLRAAFNLNSFSFGDSDMDKDVDMGLGYGIGIATRIPITNSLTFNSELNFLYRELFRMSQSYTVGENSIDVDQSADEFALSIPLMLRFMPLESVPFYVSAGVQFDIPFISEYEAEDSYGHSDDGKLEDRTLFDVGIALGVGYHITENLVADFRFVIGMTNLIDKSGDDSSLSQIGLGVSYFF